MAPIGFSIENLARARLLLGAPAMNALHIAHCSLHIAHFVRSERLSPTDK